jgi:serine/threonine protein kinase
VLDRIIGRYRFVELLGKGAMGEVYRAHDLRLRRDVAVKVLDPKLLSDESIRKRFLAEARLQGRLEHPGIVPIYDLVKKRRDLFIVMRFVEGANLNQMLAHTARPLSIPRTCTVFGEVLGALGFAHRHGVVHRDLKPANIMIDKEGFALVLDFGVAEIVGTDPTRGQLTGSPAYMAPEQIRSGFQDARVDVYAAGMALYWALTGRHPFEGAKDLETILEWQVGRIPLSPRTFRPGLPQELEEMILRAIRKDPRERFRSCEEFKHALAAFELGSTPSFDEDTADTSDDDARWDPRARLEYVIELWRGEGHEMLFAKTLDISPGGCLVHTEDRMVDGETFHMEINIDDQGPQIVGRCEVAWADQPGQSGSGIVGLRFIELHNADKERLAQAVRRALMLGIGSRRRDLRDTMILTEDEAFRTVDDEDSMYSGVFNSMDIDMDDFEETSGGTGREETSGRFGKKDPSGRFKI